MILSLSVPDPAAVELRSGAVARVFRTVLRPRLRSQVELSNSVHGFGVSSCASFSSFSFESPPPPPSLLLPPPSEGFFRRRPPSGDIEKKNAVQPKVGVQRFGFWFQGLGFLWVLGGEERFGRFWAGLGEFGGEEGGGEGRGEGGGYSGFRFQGLGLRVLVFLGFGVFGGWFQVSGFLFRGGGHWREKMSTFFFRDGGTKMSGGEGWGFKRQRGTCQGSGFRGSGGGHCFRVVLLSVLFSSFALSQDVV